MDPFAAKWVTSFVACLWRGGGGVDVHRSGLASVSKHFHEPNLEARSSHTYILDLRLSLFEKPGNCVPERAKQLGFPLGACPLQSATVPTFSCGSCRLLPL